MARRMLAAVAVCLLWTLVAEPARAQCRPPGDSHESRLLAFYAVPLAFSADPGALSLAAGSVRLALEGALVPVPSSTLRTMRYCYAGKVSGTQLARAFGRPRIAVGLPKGFGADVSYLPPITVGRATPNFAGFGLWVTRPTPHAGPLVALTARLHATMGYVRGPITCPRGDLQQQSSDLSCYGAHPSRDEYRPNVFGSELLGTIAPGGPDSRVRFGAGIGVNVLRPHFRVGFTYLDGVIDRTSIESGTTRVAIMGNAIVKVSRRCDATLEGYGSVRDAATVRGVVGCRVRQ